MKLTQCLRDVQVAELPRQQAVVLPYRILIHHGGVEL